MKEPLVMECAQCGEFFEAKRQHAKTCSPKCRQAWARGLRRARAEAAKEYAKRRADLGTQLTIPGTVDPLPESCPAGSLGCEVPEPLKRVAPVPVPTVPTVPTVPPPIPAPIPAPIRGRLGNGPGTLSDALSEAIRKITHTGAGSAV